MNTNVSTTTKKIIFIASSSESLHYARAIAECLRSKGVHPLVWDDPHVFSLGGLTFECIEEVAAQVHGAVIIASPDIRARSRRGVEVIPRPNVLLELGFFVGRLSRKQIAFCLFEGVAKPSDLTDFTHLPLGKFQGSQRIGGAVQLDANALSILSKWCDRLETTLEGQSRTLKCHGYSGLWKMELHVGDWRGIKIEPPDQVFVLGTALFHIPPEGLNGTGVFYGQVFAKLAKKGKRPMCDCVFRVVDRLDNVSCGPTGSISFTSETVSRELHKKEGDVPPPAQSNSSQPWTYNWKLRPTTSDKWDFEGRCEAHGIGAISWSEVYMGRDGLTALE